MTNTLRFEIVTGIKSGYKDLKPNDIDEDNIAAKLWQNNAEEEFFRSGIFVSAVIKRSFTVYEKSRGCPLGGERTVVITGTALKEYLDNLNEWKTVVLKLAAKLKEDLGQEFLTCEFMNTEAYYFKS